MPHRKKFPHVVHFNVPLDCFETNLRHQKCYSKGGEKFVGVAVYWDRKAVLLSIGAAKWQTALCKTRLFAIVKTQILRQRVTGWNWANSSNEKHQDNNWVGSKIFDKWCEKRKITVDLKTAGNSSGLEWNSAKVLRWSENRARPSINSKCIDWN